MPVKLTVCPVCGQRSLEPVKRTVRRTYRGRRYLVPNLEFHQCAECGEKVYGPEALRRIQSCSPGYRTKRGSTAAA